MNFTLIHELEFVSQICNQFVIMNKKKPAMK